MPTSFRSFSFALFTKVVLTGIAILLAVLTFRPLLAPGPVQAQTDSPRFYIEPGNTWIRKPGGEYQGQGKMFIDLRTGDIWGCPTSPIIPIRRTPGPIRLETPRYAPVR
jgi:hypothetical protein